MKRQQCFKKVGDYSKGQSSREESAVVLAGQVWEMRLQQEQREEEG